MISHSRDVASYFAGISFAYLMSVISVNGY
uniref:Uncharacterized protein n=2 Tax=Anguilla anguilla TaxID=7936 RepID=A0A0E9QFS2_ANGAN